MIGPTWPYQYNALVADKQNVGVVLPKEGATGWADTWMLSSKATHPNCMLKWMAYATTPPVQAKTAYTFGSAPANPKACSILDKEVANYCTDYHVTDPSYFKSISYWKTPLTDCGDSRGNTCVPYSEWTSGLDGDQEQLTTGAAHRRGPLGPAPGVSVSTTAPTAAAPPAAFAAGSRRSSTGAAG